jgi:hypothetical protein
VGNIKEIRVPLVLLKVHDGILWTVMDLGFHKIKEFLGQLSNVNFSRNTMLRPDWQVLVV